MPTPGKLEFTDCQGCGKRVATTAPLCRHCNTKRTPAPIAIIANIRRPSSPDYDDPDGEESEDAHSHAALGLGGYGKDDFEDELDDRQELKDSKAHKRGLWWYVALVLLIVFSIGAFVPWF